MQEENVRCFAILIPSFNPQSPHYLSAAHPVSYSWTRQAHRTHKLRPILRKCTIPPTCCNIHPTNSTCGNRAHKTSLLIHVPIEVMNHDCALTPLRRRDRVNGL